jgi:hypothetical protein
MRLIITAGPPSSASALRFRAASTCAAIVGMQTRKFSSFRQEFARAA